MAHRTRQSRLKPTVLHQSPDSQASLCGGSPPGLQEDVATSVALTPPMLWDEEDLSFPRGFRPVSQHSALLSLTNLTPVTDQKVFVGLTIRNMSILPNCLSRRKGRIFLERKVRGWTLWPRVPSTECIMEQPVPASVRPGLSLPKRKEGRTIRLDQQTKTWWE